MSTKPKPLNAIHARVRPGSALERYLAKAPGNNTTSLHEMAAQLEILMEKK